MSDKIYYSPYAFIWMSLCLGGILFFSIKDFVPGKAIDIKSVLAIVAFSLYFVDWCVWKYARKSITILRYIMIAAVCALCAATNI